MYYAEKMHNFVTRQNIIPYIISIVNYITFPKLQNIFELSRVTQTPNENIIENPNFFKIFSVTSGAYL